MSTIEDIQYNIHVKEQKIKELAAEINAIKPELKKLRKILKQKKILNHYKIDGVAVELE